MQTKYKVTFLLILLLPLVTSPIGMDKSSVELYQGEVFQVSQIPDAVYISDVPYVWQEVNGYCMSAAISMVIQTMGMDLGFHDLFVAMGTGFSAMYIGIEQTRILYPGVMIQQPAYFDFFGDLYGLEMTQYIDSREPFGSQGAYNFERYDADYIDLRNSTVSTPFDIIRETIASGVPLAVAVDPYYLPPNDYDDIRRYSAPLEENGVAHAITIVGYNDTSQVIYIQDPGVGLWGDDWGYPEDGRWNYTMSYVDFDRTWQSAGYFALKIMPGTGPSADFEERLGEYLIERLRGDRSQYFEGIENFFFISPGKSAFSGLGLDLTVDCIADYARYFQEVDKDEVLLSLGHISEMFLTMQYHGYRNALDSIQDILPGVELTEFIDAADDAFPYFEVLTSNESITTLVGAKFRDTLLFSTFEDIAVDFQTSGDLEGSISNHQDGLDEIRSHLFAIADAWGAAADALEETLNLPDDVEPLGDSMPVVIGGSVIIILVVVFCLVRRRK